MAEKMTAAKANEIMEEGYHCSQVILFHAAERLGLDRSLALRLSSGFGGGTFHGDTCGAVAGAIMCLNMAYGFDTPDSEVDAKLAATIRELHDRFIAKHGSNQCRCLLGGWDVGIPAHREVIPTRTGVYDNCGDYCATACELLDEMLERIGK